MDHPPHRPGLDHPDGPARLPALGRPGRRPRLRGHRRDRQAQAGRPDRHAPELRDVPPGPDEIQNATPEEREALGDAKNFWDNLSGYAKEQQTRPQTIGYSLADSPAGQAAWIYAMFQDTCGTPGDAEASFTLDEILDDIMMYWLPNSGASSARLYWEMTQSGWSSPATIDDPVTVPVGFTMPPREAVRKSRRQLERRYANVVFFNEPAAGGHFFALEQPQTLIRDIRATFAQLT